VSKAHAPHCYESSTVAPAAGFEPATSGLCAKALQRSHWPAPAFRNVLRAVRFGSSSRFLSSPIRSQMTNTRFLVTGPARRFVSPWLAELAQEVERESSQRFKPFAATLRVRPASFKGVAAVGKGLSLDLDPDDVKSWEWFGSFEADLAVRARRRFTRTWSDLHSADEIRAWVQTELQRYVQELSAHSDAAGLVAAFPDEVRPNATAVVAAMPAAAFNLQHSFSVTLEGETVTIPYRIYNPEPTDVKALKENQLQVLHCLYSRHSDGFVRQRHLSHILPCQDLWVVPFIVQLAGEYVLPILEDIRAGLADLDRPGSRRRELFARFVTENPTFLNLTRQRIVSYWNVYYRDTYPVFAHYPGAVLLSIFQNLVTAPE
jgi:hypothetical protein